MKMKGNAPAKHTPERQAKWDGRDKTTGRIDFQMEKRITECIKNIDSLC